MPTLSIQTDMDSGIPKTRRRYSANLTPHKGFIVLNDDQLETFRDFWLGDTAGGALAFQWTEQRRYQDTSTPGETDSSDSTVTDTSTTDLPTAFNTAFYKFDLKNPPTAKEAGGAYEVSLSLFRLP